MKRLITPLLLILLLTNSCNFNIEPDWDSEPILKIGLIADVQYSDKPSHKTRYYRSSLWKLNEAIHTFNLSDLDFIQTLGDVIDSDWKSYDSIMPIFEKINPEIANYHLLGNHDFAIDEIHQKNLLLKLKMPFYYYSYVKMKWRFIVLDATDYSFYSNNLHNNDINQINNYFKNVKDKPNYLVHNGAIGSEQQEWLKREIKIAKQRNEKVIIFSHKPLRPLNTSANLWNDFEIIQILESSPNVVAYINGHNHNGNYIYKNGVHYVTLKGMVETRENSFAILEVYDKGLQFLGFGNQPCLRLKY